MIMRNKQCHIYKLFEGKLDLGFRFIKKTIFLQGTLPRVFLYEGISRLMAGAAPSRTQQLLESSLRHRTQRSSIICGGKGICLEF